MKRDWDLLRQQLLDIEEGREVLTDLPLRPKWTTQTEAEFIHEQRAYAEGMARIGGHLEMLIDNGYVDGLIVARGADGQFSFSVHSPRLTMSGHDLLDTMRSKPVWDKVKDVAKTKGLELTFDVIKAIATTAVKQLVGG